MALARAAAAPRRRVAVAQALARAGEPGPRAREARVVCERARRAFAFEPTSACAPAEALAATTTVLAARGIWLTAAVGVEF